MQGDARKHWHTSNLAEIRISAGSKTRLTWCDSVSVKFVSDSADNITGGSSDIKINHWIVAAVNPSIGEKNENTEFSN